jgi:hypothetical protein
MATTAETFRGAEAQAYLAQQIAEMRAVYTEAQRQLELELAKATATDFARFRANEHLKQIRAIIAALDAEARDLAEKVTPIAYERGAEIGVDGLRRQGIPADLNMGNKIHTKGVAVLTDSLTTDLLTANGSLRTQAERWIRRTQLAGNQDRELTELIAQGVARGETRKQTSNRIRDALVKELGEGAKVVVNGRKFDPDYYAELVARTRTREAVTQGSINTGVEYGVDLYQVSFHASSCPVCVPFQGKVFSLTGGDGFPQLEKRPPYHPQCGHVLLAYVPIPGKDAEVDALREFSNSPDRAVASDDDYRSVVRGEKGPKLEDVLSRPGAAHRPAAKPVRKPKAGEPKQTAAEVSDAIAVRAEPFVPAKTVQEAAEYAQTTGLALKADYTNLHLDAANAMNEAIEDTIRLFPEMRGRMEFIGSAQARNRAYKADRINQLVTRGGMSEASAKKFVDRAVGRIEARVWAQSVPWDGFKGITFNEARLNPNQLATWQVMADRMERSGFHPVGCNTLKSVVDHELGHQIDDLLDLKNNPKVLDLYRNRSRFTQDGQTAASIKEQLSQYAEVGGIEEFIAESWAEFRNNPNPRWIAREIGEIITSEATRRAKGVVP